MGHIDKAKEKHIPKTHKLSFDKGSAYYAFDSAEALNNEAKIMKRKGKHLSIIGTTELKGASKFLLKEEVDKISSGEPYDSF